MRLDEPIPFKKGDRNPDTGLIYWGFQTKPYGKYLMWLTEEKFAEYKAKEKAYGKKRRLMLDPEKEKAYAKKYRDRVKRDPTWRANRNAEARIRHKKTREQRPEIVREWKRQYHLRQLSKPEYRLRKNIRARIALCIKRGKGKKDRGTVEILGCTTAFLRKYLETRFQDGMSWENYGTHWHVDHAKPLASAQSIEEIYALCHYTNLQPLWAFDNLGKGDKTMKQQELF